MRKFFGVKLKSNERKFKTIGRWKCFFVLLILLLVIEFFRIHSANPESYWRWTGESKQNYIIDNLRFIDGAKMEWAIEHIHGVTTAEQAMQLTNQPTEQDLAPYVKLIQGRLAVPIAGEIYMINPLNVSPGAKLTRKVGTWPKGAIFRLPDNSNPAGELILPNQTN